MVSLRGQKKLGPRPDRSFFRGLIQNFRRASPPLSYAEPPPPPGSDHVFKTPIFFSVKALILEPFLNDRLS